jgi:hypothetical protein
LYSLRGKLSEHLALAPARGDNSPAAEKLAGG